MSARVDAIKLFTLGKFGDAEFFSVNTNQHAKFGCVFPPFSALGGPIQFLSFALKPWVKDASLEYNEGYI